VFSSYLRQLASSHSQCCLVQYMLLGVSQRRDHEVSQSLLLTLHLEYHITTLSHIPLTHMPLGAWITLYKTIPMKTTTLFYQARPGASDHALCLMVAVAMLCRGNAWNPAFLILIFILIIFTYNCCSFPLIVLILLLWIFSMSSVWLEVVIALKTGAGCGFCAVVKWHLLSALYLWNLRQAEGFWMGPWAAWSSTRCGGWWPCMWKGGWSYMILGVPSNPSHPMILLLQAAQCPSKREWGIGIHSPLPEVLIVTGMEHPSVMGRSFSIN